MRFIPVSIPSLYCLWCLNRHRATSSRRNVWSCWTPARQDCQDQASYYYHHGRWFDSSFYACQFNAPERTIVKLSTKFPSSLGVADRMSWAKALPIMGHDSGYLTATMARKYRALIKAKLNWEKVAITYMMIQTIFWRKLLNQPVWAKLDWMETKQHSNSRDLREMLIKGWR